MARKRRFLSTMAVCLLFIFPATAQFGTPGEVGGPAKRMPAESKDGRFGVRGGSYARNVQLATWAGDIASRLEAELNVRIPFKPQQPLWIILNQDADTQPRVLETEAMKGDQLIQRVIVHNIDQADQEDLLEAITSLLCNRLAMWKAWNRGEPNPLRKVPDWFTTGLAQHMLSDLLARNRRVYLGMWQRDKEIRPLDLLDKGGVFPGGRLHAKTCSALLYGWLKDHPDFAGVTRDMFKAWSTQQSVDTQWLIRRLGGIDSRIDLEMEWDLYVASNTKKINLWNRSFEKQVTKLKELMRFYPQELGIDFHVKRPVEWPDMISMPRTDDFHAIIGQLQARLALLSLGQSFGFQEVVAEFDAFFQGLSRADTATGGRPSAAQQARLANQLARAQGSLNRFEQRVKAAKSYKAFLAGEPKITRPETLRESRVESPNAALASSSLDPVFENAPTPPTSEPPPVPGASGSGFVTVEPATRNIPAGGLYRAPNDFDRFANEAGATAANAANSANSANAANGWQSDKPALPMGGNPVEYSPVPVPMPRPMPVSAPGLLARNAGPVTRATPPDDGFLRSSDHPSFVNSEDADLYEEGRPIKQRHEYLRDASIGAYLAELEALHPLVDEPDIPADERGGWDPLGGLGNGRVPSAEAAPAATGNQTDYMEYLNQLRLKEERRNAPRRR